MGCEPNGDQHADDESCPAWAIASYLGPTPRAGQGSLPSGTASDEDTVLATTGFVGPRRRSIGGGQVFARSQDEIVASVYSLSSAAPHIFDQRLDAFEKDLRTLVREVSSSGEFWQRTEEIGLSIWMKPSS